MIKIKSKCRQEWEKMSIQHKKNFLTFIGKRNSLFDTCESEEALFEGLGKFKDIKSGASVYIYLQKNKGLTKEQARLFEDRKEMLIGFMSHETVLRNNPIITIPDGSASNVEIEPVYTKEEAEAEITKKEVKRFINCFTTLLLFITLIGFWATYSKIYAYASDAKESVTSMVAIVQDINLNVHSDAGSLDCWLEGNSPKITKCLKKDDMNLIFNKIPNISYPVDRLQGPTNPFLLKTTDVSFIADISTDKVKIASKVKRTFGQYGSQMIKCLSGYTDPVTKKWIRGENGAFDPKAVPNVNGNGSEDYGLMRINSVHCKAHNLTKGKACQDYFENEDNNLKEAARIFNDRKEGFSAWYAKACQPFHNLVTKI